MNARLNLIAILVTACMGHNCFAEPNLHNNTKTTQLVVLESVDQLGNPDELTSCLLPGKVRNLGSRMVYIAPRQRVIISRVECDIRGGEIIKG